MEGGHAAVGFSSTFALVGKEQFMASPHGPSFEEESLGGSRGEAVVSQQQKHLSIRNTKFSIISSSFPPIPSNFLLNPVPSLAHFSSPTVPLILLPAYFGTNTQNGGRELEGKEKKPFSHRSRPDTDKVKTPFAWWMTEIAPGVFA